MSETTNKPKAHRYFVELSFDGTNFKGWQVQPKDRTVQGELIEVFSTFFREEVYVVGAGRTDTGVHASHMVAHFELDSEIESTEDAVYKLNRFLTSEIALKRIFKVNNEAHTRFSATERAYVYRIARVKNPFSVGQAWTFQRELNFAAMKEAAAMLLEYSDFACFCKADTDVKTTLCDVRAAYWEQLGDEWVFHIRADRFLRNMVRAIVGTLVEVGEGKHSLKQFKEILESGNRNDAGVSAPAEGLYLSEVIYPDSITDNITHG
ncbi:MAG: tRNA pseudouridine(38-40) synthase TruA [Flavobacteriia bacterium]|nr:tRNA pseudouridine(38-40) synthase TruA [Flavobacteriia bacterium]